jgi:hypothetical protein
VASAALTALTSTKAPYVLDEVSARRVWNWLLVRQGLADTHRLTTATQVADATLGLHAARLSSPYVIVAARTGDPGAPASLFTPAVRTQLITVRCMRKTLHSLPLHLAVAAHAATLRFRDRDVRRAILKADQTPAVIDRAVDDLCLLLQQDGALHHRIIETRLTSRNRDIRTIRLALKVAWERGKVVYLNTTTAWNREVRTFALTAAVYPDLNFNLTPGDAVSTLVAAYFDRYGPATIRDASWWSGLSAADMITALRETGRQIVRVDTPWSSDPTLMFADRLEEFRDADDVVTGVQFAAHEDSALKAYFQTRHRYLSDLPKRRAFNQIGEALPTVIADGVVVGTWSWNTQTRSVDVSLVRGRLSTPVRRQVRSRAAALTETLRRAWTPRPPTSVHAGDWPSRPR